jgi:Predicted SAM-dependent methyltransferases
MLLKADQWKDYTCLDAGNGEKLEQWKGIVLRRPDPQAIWPVQDKTEWKKADAVYHRSDKGGGSWEYKKKLPESWTIDYKDLTLKVSPTGFKHTGIFPEQAVNWDWMSQLIKAHPDEEIRVLNLFAYTGGATMACTIQQCQIFVIRIHFVRSKENRLSFFQMIGTNFHRHMLFDNWTHGHMFQSSQTFYEDPAVSYIVSFLHQGMNADRLRICCIMDRHVVCRLLVMHHIAAKINCTGRDADLIIKCNVVVIQPCKRTCRISSADPAAF